MEGGGLADVSGGEEGIDSIGELLGEAFGRGGDISSGGRDGISRSQQIQEHHISKSSDGIRTGLERKVVVESERP